MAKANRKLPELNPTELARFRSRVPVSDETSCWLWTGTKDQQGYGLIKIRQRMLKAHRLSYLLANGEDPGPMLVCHTCDTPGCNNPKHLFLGTVADNAHDCQRKNRLNTASGERHGLRKHPEAAQRGEQHWTRRMPNRIATGNRNGARTKIERMQRGSDRHNAVLTEKAVREIRSRYAAGQIQRELADTYKIKRQTVSKIISRKTWKHVA